MLRTQGSYIQDLLQMGVILTPKRPYKRVEHQIPPRHIPVNSLYQFTPPPPPEEVSKAHDTNYPKIEDIREEYFVTKCT